MIQIEHRKEEKETLRKIATDTEKWNQSERFHLMGEQEDETRKTIDDLWGSGWAAELYPAYTDEDGGGHYAVALKIGRRHAIATFERSREEGISGIEIRFAK